MSLRGQKDWHGGKVGGPAGRVLGTLGSSWKEFSAKGHGDPQKGSEPGKVMVSFASVSWALLADVHSGPPSPPAPHPAGAHSPVAPAAPSP